MISWGVFYLGLFLYRCGLAVFAQLAVSSLGDVGTYQGGVTGGEFAGAVDAEGTVEFTGIRAIGTAFTKYLGGAFYSVSGGSPIFTNLGFQTIAFIGIWRLLEAVEPTMRKRMALLLMLPTFNLWTSVTSKEALVTFLFCMVLVRFVEIERTQRPILRLSTIVFVGLLIVFKPHYAAAVCFLLGVTLAGLYVRQKATVALAFGFLSLVPLFFISDRIEELARTVASHFRVGRSTLTRDMYFVEQHDFFVKAPYGMFQSFFGPTMSEATIGPLQMASFLESVFLIGVLVFLVLRRFAYLRARDFIISGFALFWLLFPSYPFGIMNPGSAVRYRAGYIVFVVFVIMFVMLGSLYADRRRARDAPGRQPAPQPSAV